jgi:hypothetical protein
MANILMNIFGYGFYLPSGKGIVGVCLGILFNLCLWHGVRRENKTEIPYQS